MGQQPQPADQCSFQRIRRFARVFEITVHRFHIQRHQAFIGSGLRQPLLVHFTVGHEGQSRQHHKAGHHKLGKIGLELLFHRLDRNIAKHHIGRQEGFLVRVLLDHHHTLLHLRYRQDAALDLVGLHPEAPHLDLEILAAFQFDEALGGKTAHIAAAIQFPSRGETRMGEQFPARQFLVMDITHHLMAAGDAQLAPHADRNRIARVIHNKNPGIGHRPSGGRHRHIAGGRGV